jgi:acetolactate synthase-1/2/3 large subunit
MSKRTGAELVTAALEDERVPFAFGIPGAQNLELYDVLDRCETVRPILVTDEQSASFMADGVSRSSGKLGCVNLVPGAGLTHALSGIAEAFMDGVPLLVLSSGVRSDTGNSFQLHDIPQLDIARPVTKAQLRVTDGGALYNVVRRACRIAQAPPQGPVIVEIPANLLVFRHEQDVPEVDDELDTAPTADRPGLEAAADRLGKCQRPLLYLGLGALGAGEDLVSLAECLQSPVTTTIQGKGVFPEGHPLSVWCGFGPTAPAFVRSLTDTCDATLAIGCRFAEVGTGSYGLDPPKPLIHVDINPDVFNKNYEADLTVEADAAAFVKSLLAILPDRDRDEELVRTIARGHDSVRHEWSSRTGKAGVSGPGLTASVQQHFGPDAIYVADSGNRLFMAAECLRLDRPRSFLAPVDFSSMGYALPAAIGAKLVNPDRPVAAFMGDGAFLMTGLELMTAAQLNVPVALFVLRDHELTQIAQFQDTAFAHRSASDLPDFDLSGLCHGLHVRHMKISNDTEISEGVAEARAALSHGPVVVEVLIDNTQRTFFTSGVVRTNFGRLPWGDRIRFVARALGRRLLPDG